MRRAEQASDAAYDRTADIDSDDEGGVSHRRGTAGPEFFGQLRRMFAGTPRKSEPTTPRGRPVYTF